MPVKKVKGGYRYGKVYDTKAKAELIDELMGPTYRLDSRKEIHLESKEDLRRAVPLKQTNRRKMEVRMVDPDKLTKERGSTHGNARVQFRLAQSLKHLVRVANEARVHHLEPYQMEAIEMIMVKCSRILVGDPSEPDHWRDIQGYAHLGQGNDN